MKYLFLLVLYSCNSSHSSNSSSPEPTTTTPTLVTPTGNKNVAVSWNANHEFAVNSAGGGYRVYYSTVNNFNISGSSFVNVPYVSGTYTPANAIIPNLAKGIYYIKVVAYSKLNSGSTPSAQITITVP